MKIKIKGMSCAHCENRIKDALKGLGASNIKVSANDGYAQFDGDLSENKIKGAIENDGFEYIGVIE